MLAEVVCDHASTAEVVSTTILGLGGMSLTALILYGLYKMVMG